jgi:kynureninase
VILDVPDGAAVAASLIARGVIIDYRPDAGVRLAPHFYNTEDEIDRAMATLDELVEAVVER